MATENPTQNGPTPGMPQQLRDQIAAATAMRTDMDNQNAPPEGDAGTPPGGEPSQPAGDAPPPPAADGAPPAQAQPGEDNQTWEQRARSLQGRLEQSNRSNAALSERLNKLDQVVATMQAHGQTPPSNVPPPPAAKLKLVSDDEARDYGDEFLTVVGKRAREEYFPEFEQLAARLRNVESRVDGVGTVIEKTQVNDVYTTLQSVVPNWRTINKAEEFKAWLGQPDGYSGRRRHDMLQEAFARHETDRVVRFFQGFLTEATGLPPIPQASGPSAPPLPSNGNGSGKPSLADFAAPGRARSAPQDLPPDKPQYTNAWIAQFMADKRTGKYRGREADADAIERDIYQAQHEGRIH